MEDLKKHTPTELLKLLNDTKAEHDRIKQEIVDYTHEVDELEEKINKKLVVLDETEKKYITLLEELDNK